MQSPTGGAEQQQQQSPHSLVEGEGGANLLTLPEILTTTTNKEEGEPGLGRSGATPPMLIVSGPNTGSLDYVPALRVKDELQRSISTPQVGE